MTCPTNCRYCGAGTFDDKNCENACVEKRTKRKVTLEIYRSLLTGGLLNEEGMREVHEARDKLEAS